MDDHPLDSLRSSATLRSGTGGTAQDSGWSPQGTCSPLKGIFVGRTVPLCRCATDLRVLSVGIFLSPAEYTEGTWYSAAFRSGEGDLRRSRRRTAGGGGVPFDPLTIPCRAGSMACPDRLRPPRLQPTQPRAPSSPRSTNRHPGASSPSFPRKRESTNPASSRQAPPRSFPRLLTVIPAQAGIHRASWPTPSLFTATANPAFNSEPATPSPLRGRAGEGVASPSLSINALCGILATQTVPYHVQHPGHRWPHS